MNGSPPSGALPSGRTSWPAGLAYAGTLLVVLLAVSSGLTFYAAAVERRVRPHSGLIETIYDNADLRDPPFLRRRVSVIDLSLPAAARRLSLRYFSVRWDAFWDIGDRQAVDVYAGADDRVIVVVDGQLVLQRGRQGHHTESRTLMLAPGVHRLQVEYAQDAGSAYVNVQWAPVGASPRPLVPETLFPEVPDQGTLSTARLAVRLWRGAVAAWAAASILILVLLGVFAARQWTRCGATDRIKAAARRWRGRATAWADRYEQAAWMLFAVGLAAVTLSVCIARFPGLNPESLWADDLAWAAITRSQDLRAIFLAPTHAPPGFLALLWVFRMVFRDPEWSQQLVPFICGIASVPILALAVRLLTRSDGLALVAATLAALNPLLAHYTVFVKQYSLDFMATALLLLAGAAMLGRPEIQPIDLARLAILSAVGTLFSVASVFLSLPTVLVVALRAGLARPRRARAVLLTVGGFGLLLVAAYVMMRHRTVDLLKFDLHGQLGRLVAARNVWAFLTTTGRRVLSISLPGAEDAPNWWREAVSWALPVVGLGFVWLLARRSTRAMAYIVLGFVMAFLFVSYTRLYPLTTDRRSIFSFPVFICLFVMGLHLLTEAFPRRELLRLTLGLAAAGFAVLAPIQVRYLPVNDVRLIQRLSASLELTDGLILSQNGAYLAAYYGTWPVVMPGIEERRDGTRARIVRDLTLHLPPRGEPGPAVERFLEQSRPARIWYVAFRTAGEHEESVLKILADHAYAIEPIEHTTKGTLYEGVLR